MSCAPPKACRCPARDSAAATATCPRDFAFAAIDEAQLGIDPERGHVFTDRMLRARGREETLILGSDTLKPMIRELLPEAEIVSRPRFSTLRYAGSDQAVAPAAALAPSSPSPPSRSTRWPRCCAASRAARRW